MRDGVKLFTSIYVPRDSTEKHPILMERTPYNCAPYGANEYRDFWSGYKRFFLHEGYIMVIQDVRGRWMSEGICWMSDPSSKMPKNRAKLMNLRMLYDAIDWL
jgi:predicted acyl esterase